MSRPRRPRRLRFNPEVVYFKPRGVPMRGLKEVVLGRDEVEALKLYQVDEMDQKEAAKEMGVSQPTFGRILMKAERKVSRALILGMAIRIEDGE